MTLTIVSRDEWMALPSRTIHLYVKQFKRIYLMNSHSRPCTDELYCHGSVRLLQKVHMNKQMHHDIRYNFLIGGDGNVYEGRGWHATPLMPKKYEIFTNASMLIALIGEYTADTLPPHMDKTVCDLIKYGVQQELISKTYLFYDIMTGFDQNRVLGRYA